MSKAYINTCNHKYGVIHQIFMQENAIVIIILYYQTFDILQKWFHLFLILGVILRPCLVSGVREIGFVDF